VVEIGHREPKQSFRFKRSKKVNQIKKMSGLLGPEKPDSEAQQRAPARNAGGLQPNRINEASHQQFQKHVQRHRGN
jgi:hypothetical protein